MSTSASNPAHYDETSPPPVHRTSLEAHKDRFGGMKFGACFFGWLTATGLAVLLSTLLGAVGFGLDQAGTIDPNQAQADPAGVGLAGAIVLLVVVLIAYFAGGYVAGRMARFDGVKQGLGVWLWALIITVVLAVVGVIANAQFDVLGRIQGIPRIPINTQTVNTAGILTAIGVAVVSLIGALLGGLTGMRYHRRIDRAGAEG